MKRRNLVHYLAVSKSLDVGIVDAQHLKTAFSQGCASGHYRDANLELRPGGYLLGEGGAGTIEAILGLPRFQVSLLRKEQGSGSACLFVCVWSAGLCQSNAWT